MGATPLPQLRLNAAPQWLLTQGRNRLDQIEYVDQEAEDLVVFGGEGIHSHKVLRSFLEIRRTVTVRLRKGQILVSRQGPGGLNDLRRLRKEGERQAIKPPRLGGAICQ